MVTQDVIDFFTYAGGCAKHSKYNITFIFKITLESRFYRYAYHTYIYTCIYAIIHIYTTSVYSLSCLTLCDPMDCSTPGFPVCHQLPELAQTHVPWVDDAIQPPHHLSVPPPSAFNLYQRQGLFWGDSPLHQVAKVWELQLQHQSFQWIFRDDYFYD